CSGPRGGRAGAVLGVCLRCRLARRTRMIASEQADTILALTRDARFAPFALSAIPAWLWASDASRVLWANASGAAALGAASPAALTERIFQADEPVAADVARLGGSLPHSGAPRLERVRGIG